jgi:DNA replication protein DnaC
MDVVGWVDRWEKERIRKPLILTGSVGVGKTYQGVGALRAIGVRTTTGKLILVNCVRLDWATRQEMDEWADSRALLLDDFGVKLSPSALARVYELVDRRTTDLRPLIVTTNLDITQAFKLDERIASRLSEGFWLTLDGVDRRVKR